MEDKIGMKYSGLMSVYKKEDPQLFEKALTSIINQTMPPAQMVLIEDGKLTTELLDIVEKMQVRFEKNKIFFKIIRNEKNLGLGLSLKKGVESCSYSWIARFDSDDISVNYRMEESINYVCKNPNVKLLGSYIAEIEKDTNKVLDVRKVPKGNVEIKRIMGKRNPFNHMTVFFERETILKAGNYKDVPYFEDYYLWLRVLSRDIEAANIGKVLVKATVDANFLNKRGGAQYLKKEFNFQSIIYKEKYISFPVFVFNILTRGMVRIFPKRALKYVYKIIRK
ncbi:glycosyl transferase [Ligilactobacillus pabuli]|uniref:Glycosyl transferase n=1 Tax=Ligilactobacillus pabuli TaxID=2886039 RepID=A0ABQ5JJU6_9LACO|nr:glycosyltransferase [Ligilactobacillus pabuli]GKS82325.1 glycosyl transferase [Ligilactobacillus pabuli]